MPGAARQQVTLFCVAQNTSNQTKRHPAAPALRASLGFPKRSGGCGTRATRSDSPRRRPPIFSKNRGGAEGDYKRFCGRGLALRPLTPALSPLGRGGRCCVVRCCGSFLFKGKARMGMGCAFRSLDSTPSSAAIKHCAKRENDLLQ